MFCQNCGKEIAEQAVKCVHCGAEFDTGNQAKSPPPNYLAHSIIVTILCCWPLGIPAIVYAAQVNSKFAAGDYDGACEASKNAKKWTWISCVAGAIAFVVVVLVQLLGLAATAGQQ